MDGNPNKKQNNSKKKMTNSVPKGILSREYGFKQKGNGISKVFEFAAEHNLVTKNYEETVSGMVKISIF